MTVKHQTPHVIKLKKAEEYVITFGALRQAVGDRVYNGWLKVRNGCISWIGEGDPPAGNNNVTIDFKKKLLSPSLIDAHVHLALNPGGLDSIRERVDLASSYGLAAVRDGGDRLLEATKLKREISTEMHVSVSGAALYAPGRYGSFLGRQVSNRSDILSAIKEFADSGVDQIKVLASGPVSLKIFGSAGGAQFDESDMSFIVKEAGNAGLRVMAHANGREAVTQCVKAGVESVEHGYFMGRDAIRMMADNFTAWIPTIEPLGALCRAEADDAGKKMIKSVIDDQLKQLSLAVEYGVNTVMGTDAGSPGNPAGPSLYNEAKWWRDAGCSNDYIIAAATVRAADLLGLAGKIGTVEVGKQAFINIFPLEKGLNHDVAAFPEAVMRPEL